MAFEDDVAKFIADTERRNNDVFVESTVQVRRSIVEGSAITTAPGQPVDTGFLRASFVDAFTSKTSWTISTNTEYAEVIEDGVGQLRSQVGGHHSVKLTVGGWDRIIEHANRVVK